VFRISNISKYYLAPTIIRPPCNHFQQTQVKAISQIMISLLHILTLALLAPSALAIYCFECDSSQHFSCTEFWDPTLLVTEQVTFCDISFQSVCKKVCSMIEKCCCSILPIYKCHLAVISCCYFMKHI